MVWASAVAVVSVPGSDDAGYLDALLAASAAVAAMGGRTPGDHEDRFATSAVRAAIWTHSWPPASPVPLWLDVRHVAAIWTHS